MPAAPRPEEAIIAVKMNEEAIRSSKSRRDDDQDADLDIRLVRFEQLLDRRLFLINDLLPAEESPRRRRMGVYRR